MSQLKDHLFGSSHFGAGQTGGGLPLAILSRESLPLGVLHIIVSPPEGNLPPLRYLGPTYSRSVHHSAEQPSQRVLFTPPRPSGLAGQFPVGRLVAGSTICTPVVTPVPCSSHGDPGRSHDFSVGASEEGGSL